MVIVRTFHVVDLPSFSFEVNSSDVLDADIVALDEYQTIQLPDGTVAVIKNLTQC